MEGNLKGWDANDIEPAGDFSALPEGDYKACIVASGFKLTKKAQESGRDEDGQFLELTIQVIDGPHNGRTVFDRLNLYNPNDQAVDIAKRQLSSICRAVGKMTPQDSSELHNIPFTVKLGTKQYDGKTYNEVKSYKAIKPADEPAKQDARQPATAAAGGGNGGGKKAPWAR